MIHRIFILLAFFCLSSCLHDEYAPEVSKSGYPPEVAAIISKKCATSGCHSTASKSAAAGLDLSTWDHMFEGSSSGAVTIPYSAEFSTLLYYTNVDSLEGIVAYPTMPYSTQPLSKEDYQVLKDWILRGAPDENHKVKYSENPFRKKIYIANQGCDNVAVIDGESKNVMRYINVGLYPGAIPVESPHMIKMTPDNKSWVVIFSASSVVQVFDAVTDQLKFSIPVDTGGWNTFTISSDSKSAYICNYTSGKIMSLNLERGTVINQFTLSYYLHGITLNKTDDTLYICQNMGGALFKVPVNNPGNFTFLNLYGGNPTPVMPHQILFTSDYQYYIVTCEGPAVNQVRVYRTSDDMQVHAIPVGIKPEEMSVSQKKQLLFVTCKEDNFYSGTKGSVRVIDLNTFQEIKKIQVGWRPHGIAVDDEEGLVYVANTNDLGPNQHHPSACTGQNGNLSVIDLNTLEVIPSLSAELSVSPYSVAIRK